MEKSTQENGISTDEEHWSILEQLAREGARRMLKSELENEIAEYIEAHRNLVDEDGRQAVVKNGYHAER